MTISVSSHPAFADFSEVIPLSGFSGATVALLRHGSSAAFVRKAANTVAGNPGIVSQTARQIWLKSAVDGAAIVPAVLGRGEAEGLNFYDMEFMPARDAVNYLTTATFDQVAEFSDRIATLMGRLSETKSGFQARPPSRQLFEGKLAEIATRTGNTYEREMAPLVEASSLISGLLDSETATATHGDLTFENILVDRRGALCLIDPIESPFDHYWFDWSKLFQECEGHWHRHRGRRVSASVTWWLRERWVKVASLQSPLYPTVHYLFLALTFARILPYTRDAADRAFVAQRVERFGRAAVDTIRSSG